MTQLRSFKDTESSCYSTIEMNYGTLGRIVLEHEEVLKDYREICQISVEQTGVIVKKFIKGMVGLKEYGREAVYDADKIGTVLHQLYPDDLSPQEMKNPVLKSFTNAILHCSNLDEVTRVLNKVSENV